MKHEELAIVVDEQDNVLEYRPRSLLTDNDRVRISSIWIENSKGQVLLAKRAQAKKVDPGKWGPAAAGTVEKGESYKQNAKKELKEELGIDATLTEYTKIIYVSTRNHKRACQWFKASVDLSEDEFKLQTSEVQQVKWIEKARLVEDIKYHPENYVGSANLWIDIHKLS